MFHMNVSYAHFPRVTNVLYENALKIELNHQTDHRAHKLK